MDNEGKPKQKTHNFANNSSIFTTEICNLNIFFSVGNCNTDIFIAKELIGLVGGIRAVYFMAGCRYILHKGKDNCKPF